MTERGIVGIVDGEWTVVYEPAKPFEVELLLGGDGRVYAFGPRELSVVDEHGLHSVVTSPRGVGIGEVAIGPAGEIALFSHDLWLGSGQLNLHRFEMWLSSPFEHGHEWWWIAPGFDAQGRLWTRSELGLSRREWPWPTPIVERVDVALPEVKMPFVVGSDAVYAFGDEVVYRITDAGQTRIELPGVSGMSNAAINHNNTIGLGWRGTGVLLRLELDRDRPRIEWIDAQIDCSWREMPLAIDDSNRIWVPSRTAQWVFTPGAAQRKYGLGTVPLLPSGASQVVVVGCGPELPSVGAVPEIKEEVVVPSDSWAERIELEAVNR